MFAILYGVHNTKKCSHYVIIYSPPKPTAAPTNITRHHNYMPIHTTQFTVRTATVITTPSTIAQQKLFLLLSSLQLPSIFFSYYLHYGIDNDLYPANRSMLGSVRRRRPSCDLNLELKAKFISKIMVDKQ